MDDKDESWTEKRRRIGPQEFRGAVVTVILFALIAWGVSLISW
jgi:hypothetical protein